MIFSTMIVLEQNNIVTLETTPVQLTFVSNSNPSSNYNNCLSSFCITDEIYDDAELLLNKIPAVPVKPR